ncbi:RNA-guided pseudouridylation complex pseudouridine synthase subunit Cbf5 [archaeon]|nr:RNA-guided pseudouridylation complex pseudouridine synthase subunit Cbf5 [archaeon]
MKAQFPFEKIERKTIERQKVETDKKYGISPEKHLTKERINYGIVNINKPQGPSSHQTTDYVKKILNIKKAGHSGTLDPNVTGSLIIALGKSTRVVHNLLKAGKEYVCLMHLHKQVEKTKIKQVINSFITIIDQLPPVRSAVKRKLRKREIYYIEIIEIKDKQEVLFKVGCEAGTYIRKLCHDIGIKLETGAHMQQLIRTRVGPFKDNTTYSLYELKDAYELYKKGKDKALRKIIQPVESAIQHIPKIWITDNSVDPLAHGTDLAIPGIAKLNDKIKKENTVAILTLKEELVATGKAKLTSEEILKQQKGIAVKTEKIYMERNKYPKYKTLKKE